MKFKTKHLVYILISVGLIMRIYQLGFAPFWYDEAFTAWLSDLPFVRMIQATSGDTHPPLYYFFTWIVVHLFGKSELVLRTPSVIFSMAGLWVFWLILENTDLSDYVKVLSVGFMAFMPFQLHFAQEARQYALLQFLVLIAFYLIQKRSYTWFGVFLALILYTHNYAVFYVPVLFVLAYTKELAQPRYVAMPGDVGYFAGYSEFDYVKSDQSKVNQVLISAVAAGISFIPWAVVLLGQMKTVSSGYWIQPVTVGSVVYSVYMWFWAFALGQSWQPVAIMITLFLVMAALVMAVKNKSYGLLAFGPLFMAVAVSFVWKPVLLFRGLAASAPFIYLLIAIAIGSLKKWQRVYTAGLIAPVFMAGVISFYIYNVDQKTGDLPLFLDTIQGEYQPGDVIVHANDGAFPGLHYYASDIPQYELSECDQHNLGSLSPVTREAMGIEIINDLSGFNRVWFVYSNGPTSTKCEEQKAREIINQSVTKLEIQTEHLSNGVYLWQSE